MIKFVPAREPNTTLVVESTLHAKGFNNPVIAKELLKISGGQYITQEIVSRVILARMANPQLENTCDLNDISYTLGEPRDGADFGSYEIPVAIYARTTA